MTGSRRRAFAAAAALLALASGCTGGDGKEKQTTADDLTRLAVQADELTYTVTYTYSLSGPLAPAQRSTLTLAQKPPNDLRTIETVTPTSDGDTQTTRAWYAKQGDESYACWEDAEGVRCRPGATLAGRFGLAPIDELLLLARTPDAFRTVREAGTARVAGRSAKCYRAEPPKPTPVPLRSPQPRFVPESYRFDYCFSSDGVLLRARRRITGDVPSDVEREGRQESTLQAQSVSRTVNADDLELPGEVVEPEG